MIITKEQYSIINERLLSLEQRISDIEKNFTNSFSLLEYRIWQYNSAINQMLYEQLLSQKTKKTNFHPLVSIVIPVYNGSNYLSEAIKSAINQTYDNIEIIVVNDGSNDNGKTEKIAKSFGDKIIFFKKSNGGVSSALNYGIKKMHGKYFAWLSHDDLITKNHIENLVNWFSYQNTNLDIPFSNFDLIDEKGHILLNDTIKAQLFCSDFKISYYHNYDNLLQGEINGGSVLIPRQALLDYGLFDESQKITQERDMWHRLIKKYHFINIPYTTASIRCHNAQVTNTNTDIAKKTNLKNYDIITDLLGDKTNITPDEKLFILENLKRSYHDNSKEWLFEEISKLIQNEKQ